MAIAQVLEVPTETDTAPSPVIELPVRRPAPAPSGWRSRCVATLAYLLTLAGLVAVATLGSGDTSPAEGSAPSTTLTVADATP